MKKYLKERFGSSVNGDVPTEVCSTQICDLMWLLFKFHPEDESTGENLVDFFWRPVERFFTGGGTTYVCVFDAPHLVPVAKAEEHRRRYGGAVREPLESGTCDAESLPRPWSAALADRGVRALMCAYIARGVERRFRSCGDALRGKAVYVSGVGDRVTRVDHDGVTTRSEHAAAAGIGEGDLAVAYWVQAFHDEPTIVRVLDSDQIPILQLRAQIADRRRPLFIWLVNPRRDDQLPYHGYGIMPYEGHTLVNVLALNAEITKANVRVEEFCFHVICQKTDFVDKVITNLGVALTLTALEKNVSGAIRVTASSARCDARLVKRSFEKAIAHSKRKRAEIRSDGDVEFRRAWWTLCYWSYAWAGPLPDELRPRAAFGFDEKGLRTNLGKDEAYPVIFDQ